MELNINGFTARTYRWFYAKEKMPQNLCPYFWELVIMWVLIIPVSIISIPMVLINKDEDYISLPAKIFGGLLIYVMIFLIFCMFVAPSVFWNGFYVSRKNIWDEIQIMGFIGWAIAIFFSSIGLLQFIREKIRSRRYKKLFTTQHKGSKKNIVLEFIKAKYNRYCPKIEWKYENDER